MIPPTRTKCIVTCAALLLSFALPTWALPIDYNEISLLVRARENENSIIKEVTQRRLLRALSPQQESKLRSQGAKEPLVVALRNSNIVLSPQEAAAAEQERAALREKFSAPDRKAAKSGTSSDARTGKFEIFDVSYGHPVNLSEWGGPDYEFAFHCRRFAGEDIIEPIMTHSSQNYVDTATYLGAGRREDSTTVFDDRNYVSVMAYSASRPVKIDMQHPVGEQGLPYLMYPVYGAGGVSLYYIGSTGGAVRLAVSTRR